MLKRRDVRRRFDRAADGFDGADFVHAVTRDGLFARLEPMVVDATRVIDLGCATGAAVPRLEKRFRKAAVIGVDFSAPMLRRARGRRRWLSRAAYLQADATRLPLADHSIDVVFSNLLLPWLDDPADAASEVCRVLRKDGLFVFATLGPDSLLELKNAWRALDDFPHVNRFLDMHDVGDALLRAGLRDPVLDVDRLTVSYDSPQALFRDLSAAGARNSLLGRRKSLTGRGVLQRMQQQLLPASTGGSLQLDLELVYGHCWGRGPSAEKDGVRIDAGSIPLRQR